MSLIPDGGRFRQDPDNAFLEALRSGRLSEDEKAVNFIGDVMYMYTDAKGVDLFKHKHFRFYLDSRGRPLQ